MQAGRIRGKGNLRKYHQPGEGNSLYTYEPTLTESAPGNHWIRCVRKFPAALHDWASNHDTMRLGYSAVMRYLRQTVRQCMTIPVRRASSTLELRLWLFHHLYQQRIRALEMQYRTWSFCLLSCITERLVLSICVENRAVLA
jgi:hypothetical protein